MRNINRDSVSTNEARYHVIVLPHMRILAHTRMGRPIRVWDNIMSSHTRMGVPYEYTCMIVYSYTIHALHAGINFCLLTKY